MNPESTFFNIEILKTNYVKTVPVEIDIIGGPSYGYKVSGIDLDPVSIKINGSINELQNILYYWYILIKPFNVRKI